MISMFELQVEFKIFMGPYLSSRFQF